MNEMLLHLSVLIDGQRPLLTRPIKHYYHYQPLIDQ